MITVDTHTKVHSRSSSPAFGNAMLQAVPTSEVYLMDCIQGMKHYPDKWFDLAIVDPPYGIGISSVEIGLGDTTTGRTGRASKWGNKDWDNERPTIEYFTELFRVSKQQIICGGNYFSDLLPASRGWIVWDKVQRINQADAEMIWTSYNSSTRIFTFSCSNLQGFRNPTRFHPTEKPIALYDFCFDFAKVEAGMKILDTHLGSQSSRISANKYQLNFVGFETDEEYFNKGNKRYDDFVSQTRLF